MAGPGVSVATAVKAGPGTPLRATSGTLFIIGQSERGESDRAIELRGMADYDQLMGARVAYGVLYDQLKVFFAEGGVRAFVSRVVGPAATKGTLTFTDRASGTALSTIRVDAASEGAWSSRVSIEVRDGSVANTFRMLVFLDGKLVQDKTNLASPTAAAVAFAASPYIRVTSLGSATVAPANNPKVQAATALTAGSDDRASIVNSAYTDALADFPQSLGDGAVAIPGVGTGVHTLLIAHAEQNRRIALLSAGLNASVADLNTLAGALNSDAAGLFAPYLNVSDEAGGFRQISPEGFVAAARAKAHETIGPWRAPAGLISSASTLLGLAQNFTVEESSALDASRVSVIRVVAGTVRLYGWRSLSIDEDNFKFLSSRDVLNRLVVLGEAVLEQFVYSPIDAKGQLLSSMNAALVGIAEPLRQAGGLYERVDPATKRILDPGYAVETGASVNTAEALANNEVKALLSVRVAPTGAMVSLTIVKVGPLSAL